jgi:hypothetical protein
LFRGGTLQELVLVYVGAFLVILVKIVSSCMQAVDRALRRQVTGVGEDDAEEFVDADLGNVSWRQEERLRLLERMSNRGEVEVNKRAGSPVWRHKSGFEGWYYAVHRGRVTGIYTSWEECQKQTNRFKGAISKSFGSLHEAQVFI